MHGLSIGKLAQAAEVSIDTIRFYEKRGLLKQPTRRPSGFREYTDQDLRRLKFVRRARALGFALEEISELLDLADERNVTVIRQVIERRLTTIDDKIIELQHWHRSLQDMLDAALSTPQRTYSALDFLDAPAPGDRIDEGTKPRSPHAKRLKREFHDED
jgi:MerR family transcriptional regulator, copper efflux regulator